MIEESNIESYFVWIPRYRYKIFNEGDYEGYTPNVIEVESKAQIIEVVFERNSTPISNGSKVGEWLTHPAFTSMDSNGMWVGKFETSKSNENPDNSINPSGVQIKPNISSWRYIQVANAFYTSYNYKRNLDSHMMKNTEWGAVAYLQQSSYGSHVKVRFNNHLDYVTGYAANIEPTCGYSVESVDCNTQCKDGTCNSAYNTSTGYLASTTGNITGIYDMSGNAWEVVMAVMLDQSGNPISGNNNDLNSGFIGVLADPSSGSNSSKTTWTVEDGGLYFPESKYYDAYPYNSNDMLYRSGKLGDATKEMGPFFVYQTSEVGSYHITNSWYNEISYILRVGFPWLIRGGDVSRGREAGLFSYHPCYGSMGFNNAFRVVLSTK